MKKRLLLLLMGIVLHSCAFNLEETQYNFDNFKETPLWDLAKAVRADDADLVKEILKNKKFDVDLKDPEFNQTLLVLSVVNNKRNAFTALLNSGANPNILVGNPKDATPFIKGIISLDDCDLFFIESMLKHGADPNMEIKNPRPEFDFSNSYPLLATIRARGNDVECVNLVKLLVENGADINCCYRQPYSSLCEGVISECLSHTCMENLKYFVIEKKITIPDTVIVTGESAGMPKAYGLREVLNWEEFKFEDFESEGEKIDKSKQRKIREEILTYLDSIKK